MSEVIVVTNDDVDDSSSRTAQSESHPHLVGRRSKVAAPSSPLGRPAEMRLERDSKMICGRERKPERTLKAHNSG
jgi:hypothetical protein